MLRGKNQTSSFHMLTRIVGSTLALALAFCVFFSDSSLVYAAESNSLDYSKMVLQNYYEGSTAKKVHKDFNYSSTEQIYTVTTTGLYYFTASGASGENYSGKAFPSGTSTKTVTYNGGVGGSITFSLDLNKGDVLKVITGKVGGGTAPTGTYASDGRSGGGATRIYVNDELVAVAAGGGGASSVGDGYPAVSDSFQYDEPETGEIQGFSGGGDGFIVGKPGSFTKHIHNGNKENGGTCYSEQTFHHHTGSATTGGGCYTNPFYHRHRDSDNKIILDSSITRSNARGGCFTVQHQNTRRCGGVYHNDGWDGYYNWIKCSNCGYRKSTDHGHAGEICGRTTWDGTYYYTLGCGKTMSSVESYTTGCNMAEGQPTGYVMECDRTTDVYVPACGGTNYISILAKKELSVSDNVGNGKCSIELLSVNDFIIPYSGDYKLESSDGSAATSVGGAFTGSIHLNKGDVVTAVVGSRGTTYKILVNGKNILEYHYHKAWGRYHPTTETLKYYIGSNVPGGCWTRGSHEHNQCVSCPHHTEHNHGCGGTWRKLKVWQRDEYMWANDGNYYVIQQCTECHCERGEYPGNDGDKCDHQHTNGHVHCKEVWDCGSNPKNIWDLGCGLRDTQALYTNKFYDSSIKSTYMGFPYAKLSILKIDYSIEVDPNGGFIDITDAPTGHVRTSKNEKVQTIDTQTGTVVFLDNPEREGFTFMGWDITGMDGYSHYFASAKSSYAIKSGFEKSKNPVYVYTGNGLEVSTVSTSYTQTNPSYKYMMNLAYDNRTVHMKAIWMDKSEPEIDDPWEPKPNDPNGGLGAAFRNRDVAGDGQLVRPTDLLSSNRTGVTNTSTLVTSNTGSFKNPDSGLALFTQKGNYSISRRLGTVVLKDGINKWKTVTNIIKSDGKGNSIYKDTANCSYSILHSLYPYPEYILGLNRLSSGLYSTNDKVSVGQYPYVYGMTADGQRYYPGTWTNKSVVITATAYDGLTGTGSSKANNRNGGSGVWRMKFAEYSRYHDGTTNKKSDDWVYNDKKVTTDSTADSSMTIEKTFSASGAYQISITSEDRAGSAYKPSAGGWIGNPDGNKVSNMKYGYAKGSNALDLSTAILIDKDAPVAFDPENYLNTSTSNNTAVTNIWGKMSYAKAKELMYEGYNEVVDPSLGEKEAYGWSMDYVRIVALADDGDGSGIDAKDAAFCWVPDGSGVDYKNPKNWQPADSTRKVNGKVYPVSTRTVSEEEKGVVYIRDAVGNYAKLNYSVDHMDKEDPMVNPDVDPDPDPNPVKPVTPDPDPEDPTDPDNKPYNPEPGDSYTWFGTGDLEYDWINHVAQILLNAEDLEANSAKRPTSGDGSKTSDKHSSSGIWKMTVYPSDTDFTTVKDIRGRQRSPYYSGNSHYAESLFNTKLNLEVNTEGINCFIAEILDKAGNLTLVKFVVKIDMTNPIIASSDEQVNLNKFNEDEVENAIKSDDLMSCFFDVKFDDRKATSDVSDTSGVDYIKLRLVNPEDPDNSYGENREYVLYKYGNSPSQFSKLMSSSKTLENSLDFSSNIKNTLVKLTDVSALSGDITAKLNTFELMPHAASFFWECEVRDRAGNCSFKRSRIIPNFSVKAVIHSTEDDAFNIDSDTELTIDNNGEKSVLRRYYTYKYTRPVGDSKVFGNSGDINNDKYYTTYYKLNDAFASALGLTLVSSPDEASAVGMETSNKFSATNTVPYFQLGDFGYMEVWTVGYVEKIQMDFDVNGQETIGKEMDAEITSSKVPGKYAIGSQNKKRYVLYSKADAVVGTGHSNRDDGVPYASHYGLSEETSAAWLDEGTSIRMPLYYALTPDGTKKDDGTDNYESELHTTAAYAWKNGWKDTSLAEYVIYDTRADDVHYRVTHE